MKFEVCMFPKFMASTEELNYTCIQLQRIDFAPKKTPNLQDLADIWGLSRNILPLKQQNV